MALTTEFETIPLTQLDQVATKKAAEGYRCVQMLCVNTDDGIDLTYSFIKDGKLENYQIKGVSKQDSVPSIQDRFLSIFPFENEAVDLFGVKVVGMTLDFAGKFYQLSQSEPMTVISPAQKEAREKAAKIAAAKAAKAAKAAGSVATAAGPTEEEIQAKIAGLDPEKAAKVRAAMEAKAAKAAAAAPAAKPAAGPTEAEIEAKIAGLDPEKAAKVRAAMEAKAVRAKQTASQKEGDQ